MHSLFGSVSIYLSTFIFSCYNAHLFFMFIISIPSLISLRISLLHPHSFSGAAAWPVQFKEEKIKHQVLGGKVICPYFSRLVCGDLIAILLASSSWYLQERALCSCHCFILFYF